MKKLFFNAFFAVLLTFLAFALSSCGNKKESADEGGLWENAIYLSDTELGSGINTCIVEVTAGDRTVTFTIHTDKTIVGEALMDNSLIDGEAGAYGLYVKAVNGITADYDVDQSYWSFYIDGEYAMTGVDTTEIKADAVYKLEYTK